jgi:hypothetical protein
MEIEAEPARKEVKRTTVKRAVRAVTDGMTKLQRRAVRPPFFSDAALREAKTLADLRPKSVESIRFRRGQKQVEVTGQLSVNVDELIGPKYEGLGTIEGTLEAITIHGRHEFSIYDALDNRRVRCTFGAAIPLAEIKAGFGGRVSAYGTIHYRASGEPVSVDVESFEALPDDADLPSADDVRGLLG